MAGYFWGKENRWLASGSTGLEKGIFESKIILLLGKGCRFGKQFLPGAQDPLA